MCCQWCFQKSLLGEFAVLHSSTPRPGRSSGLSRQLVVMSAVFILVFGLVLYNRTGFGHFFAFGLLSVGLIGWRLGKGLGLVAGLVVVTCSVVSMASHNIGMEVLIRDNLMYLALALGIGGGIGHLSDTVRKLRAAYDEIRVLRGFLPICASCKSIRDDEGYWTGVEQYVSERTDIQFSHGLCPPCVQQLLDDSSETTLPIIDVGARSTGSRRKTTLPSQTKF